MTGSLPELADRPFELLLALEERLAGTNAGPAEPPAASAQWDGLAFTIGDRAFLMPRSEVGEVVEMPTPTRVPGSQPWLLGVANLRGKLLPVTDLGLFLACGSVARPGQSWMIVLNDQDVPAAFRVDEVGGFAQFAPEEQRHELLEQAPDNPAGEFLIGAFVRDGAVRWVLSLRKLARDRAFRDAGL